MNILSIEQIRLKPQKLQFSPSDALANFALIKVCKNVDIQFFRELFISHKKTFNCLKIIQKVIINDPLLLH